MVRFERVLCALVLVGLAGGCTSADDGKPAEPGSSPVLESGGAPPAWSEPAAYTFTLIRGCDAAAPLGRYQATVKDGVVTSAVEADMTGAAPVPSAEGEAEGDAGGDPEGGPGPATGEEGEGGEEIDVPALGQLIEMADTAKEDGAEVITEFDRADGHPVKVTINVTDTPAGAECWIIADYQA